MPPPRIYGILGTFRRHHLSPAAHAGLCPLLPSPRPPAVSSSSVRHVSGGSIVQGLEPYPHITIGAAPLDNSHRTSAALARAIARATIWPAWPPPLLPLRTPVLLSTRSAELRGFELLPPLLDTNVSSPSPEASYGGLELPKCRQLRGSRSTAAAIFLEGLLRSQA